MKTRVLFIVANLIGLIVLCHQLCIAQTVYSGLQIPSDTCILDGRSNHGVTSSATSISYIQNLKFDKFRISKKKYISS